MKRWSNMELKPEEIRLIQFIRRLQWGKLELEVKKGLPVMIHRPVEDVKLTDR
jgi:hypothetical protein